MFAIVEIYGKQYKVAKGDKVLVNSKIDVAEGKTIKFDSVKAISDKDNSIFEAKDLFLSLLCTTVYLKHLKHLLIFIFFHRYRLKRYQTENFEEKTIFDFDNTHEFIH